MILGALPPICPRLLRLKEKLFHLGTQLFHFEAKLFHLAAQLFHFTDPFSKIMYISPPHRIYWSHHRAAAPPCPARMGTSDGKWKTE